MSKFGVQAPSQTPALYTKELKFPANKTVRVVFLDAVRDSLQVLVHSENVLHNGRWQYVVSGDKNTHLFPAVVDPFNTHPDEKVRKLRWLRIALVYVVKGSEKLDGQLAYVLLSKSVFDALVSWENTMTEENGEVTTVAGKLVSIHRAGSGMNDTVYTATVVGDGQAKVDDNEVVALVDYLKETYKVSGVTSQELQEIFDNHLTSAQYKSGQVKVEKAVEKTPPGESDTGWTTPETQDTPPASW